ISNRTTDTLTLLGTRSTSPTRRGTIRLVAPAPATWRMVGHQHCLVTQVVAEVAVEDSSVPGSASVAWVAAALATLEGFGTSSGLSSQDRLSIPISSFTTGTITKMALPWVITMTSPY